MNEKAERKTLKDLQKEIYVFKTEKLMTLHTYVQQLDNQKLVNETLAPSEILTEITHQVSRVM